MRNKRPYKRFKSIFDGQSTTGWHSYGKKQLVLVGKLRGTLHFDPTTTQNGQGDLVTDVEYEIFI
jgi:hypothetical protein